jgi:hypothetical protein
VPIPAAAWARAYRLARAVFGYEAAPIGWPLDDLAEEASDIFSDHPGDAVSAELACVYYQRRLRSCRTM